jgi:aryl-alcohol dehydrogenase-like predicted oxidoreductase
MQLRKFQTELISEIGLGTWQLGSADWGNVTEEVCFRNPQSLCGFRR